MSFEIPALNYELNALEPAISKQTLEFHYGKHHQAYVNNLNNLLPGSDFEHANLEEIILKAEGGIFNNAAQVWNHSFYFASFDPSGLKKPTGTLSEAINNQFGSLEKFQEEFSKAAGTLFGSGWAWLSKDKNGNLHITWESNAGNPLLKGLKPILTCDVWEHAYYLDYQNRRPDYIKAFWDILDWELISSRF